MGMSALEVRRRVMLAQPHEAVASGAVASFRTDVVSALPMEFDLLPIQAGTGDPSPDNICPITGHDGFTRTGTGKNLFDKNSPVRYGQYISGVWTESYYRITTDYIPIIPHVNYMMSIDPDNTVGLAFINYNLFDKDKKWLCDRTGNGETQSFSGDKTHLVNATPNNAAYIRLTLRDAESTQTDIHTRSLENAKLMFEQGSVVTAYQPFGHSYTTIFPVLSANQWDEECEVGKIAWGGHPASGTNQIRSKNFIPVVAGEEYRIATSNSLQFFYYDEDKTLVSYEANSKINGATITIPSGCCFMKFYTYGTGYGEVYKNDIAINYPSSVTAYNPYNKTVYGGTVTDNGDGTGTLVIKAARVVIDGVNKKINGMWTNDNGKGASVFYTNLSNLRRSSTNIYDRCDRLVISDDGYSNMLPYSCKGGSGATGTYSFALPKDDVTTVQEADAWFAQNATTVIYDLVTPVTYTLPLTALQSLIGQNHIWVDNADSVSVEYWGH